MPRLLLISLIIMITLSSCGPDDAAPETSVTQDDIINDFAIEKLLDETYYLPAKRTADGPTQYQPLRRFDLVFTGHTIDGSTDPSDAALLAQAIPGHYTHIFSYLGKDSDGFAYAVEMNTDEAQTQTIGLDGLSIAGRLYVYCLGSDLGLKECPKDTYHYGPETYDYMWAKRLDDPLKTIIDAHETELIATIKADLNDAFAFQLPFYLGLDLFVTKEIRLVDDSRANGADCTAYFTSLFETVAGVCLEDVEMDAAALQAYYLFDPIGQEAIIPEAYNVVTHDGDLRLADMITDYGYTISDDAPRQTACPDARIVMGIPTPDRVFESPSMIDIEPVDESMVSSMMTSSSAL